MSTDSPRDGGAFDAASVDGTTGFDAGGLPCGVYRGSFPVCAHLVDLCNTCDPAQTGWLQTDPCFTAQCDADESIHSVSYAAAYIACYAQCGNSHLAYQCVQSETIDLSSQADREIIREYCAVCDPADAGGCSLDSLGPVLTWNTNLHPLIAEQCIPRNAGADACRPEKFFECAQAIAQAHKPSPVGCDAGTH